MICDTRATVETHLYRPINSWAFRLSLVGGHFNDTPLPRDRRSFLSGSINAETTTFPISAKRIRTSLSPEGDAEQYTGGGSGSDWDEDRGCLDGVRMQCILAPMTYLAWIIYIPLQTLWLPLSVLGALWVAYKQIVRSKALRLSQTAIEIINGRWTGHVFGLRKDVASYKLAGHLPNNSVLGLWVALFPLLVAKMIAGKPILYPKLPDDAESGIANMVFSRSRRFDGLIEQYTEQVQQFVVLGAGLDARAYGPLADRGLGMFELDQASTQWTKRRAVARAKLRRDHVHYIEVDFSDPAWVGTLTASPFDWAKPTIFLWEGVTLYLNEASVRATLSAIKAQAAQGSVILVDFYADRMLDMARKGAMVKTLEATGESMDFGFDFSSDAEGQLSAFLTSAGLELGPHFFQGASHKKGAYMVVAALHV